MQQVLFRLPIFTTWSPDGIPVYGFGMMLFLAFVICTWLGGRRAQKVGINPEVIQDLAIWLFLGGLIGARLAYILQQEHPGGILEVLWLLPQIWEGGIILYGSVLGGLASYALAYWLVFRKQGISTLKLCDVIAPSIAVGLCLGRIGCFLNGCCYGQVACSDCPVYTVHFPLSAPARYDLVRSGYQTTAGFTLADHQPEMGVRVGEVEAGSPAWQAGLRPEDVIEKADGRPVSSVEDLTNYLAYFTQWPRGKTDLTLTVYGQSQPLTFTPRTIGLHPTQLYESVSMILLFLLLLAYAPFRTRDGQLMALLMLGYGMHRYLNELLRNDPRPEGFESYGSVILIAGGIGMWVWLLLQPAQYRVKWR
jgi:prolipoprotein diacylglyceryltransferase